MRAHTLTIVLTALLLAGCGQKGPLYLPAEADTQHSQTGTPAEVESSETETDQNNKQKQAK